MKEIWIVKNRTQEDIIDQLLQNRNIGLDAESKRKYFEPDFVKDLSDPFLIKNIREACDRIVLAQKNKEKVGIFADYDADGIPGAAIFYKALTKIGIASFVYIPDRDQGYGLNKEGIDKLVSLGCGLIITIDLGIKNFDEAAYCLEKKIDLIITDHHLPGEKIPKAFLTINPKIEKKPDSNIDLCGCAVAYKLISALSINYPEIINDKFLKWNLDLVAISTIADIVPLTNENRVLAKYGLIVLKKTKNIGLIELIKISKINRLEIDAYTAGFKIGPRINAPGRIGSATASFELLVTEENAIARKLAINLNEKNENRQTEMENAILEINKIISDKKLSNNNIIILRGNWLKGILGPTASRISDQFSRPVIIFTENEDKYVGSARSVGDIDIMEIISSSDEYLLKYGGHRGAAGLTILNENYDRFNNSITKYANNNILKTKLVKSLEIDLEIKPEQLSIDLLNKITEFEPFGFGNSRVIMIMTCVRISKIKNIGRENKHLSFDVEKNGFKLRAVYFNYDPTKISSSNIDYDVVFSPKINEWNESRTINLNIISLRFYDGKK